VTYADKFAGDFARLNYEWIERLFTIEEEDVRSLSDPRGYVIDQGGEIFFVLAELAADRPGVPVATVAMTPHDPGVFELAKMAVDPDWQGHGLGRLLIDACIEFAEQREAREIMLVTNDGLAAALGLYRSAGFQAVAEYSDVRYSRGNLEMRRKV
jgi:ribosomal protein S18 acetylase RimI-like enzyme